jgi:hypothetical protein
MNYLFFAPYSGVWPAAMPESLIARELQSAGHNVHVIRCDRELNKYCSSMTSHGLRYDSSLDLKEKVCSVCTSSRNILNNQLDLGSSLIKDHLTPKNYDLVNHILESANLNNWEDIRINEVDIGKLATYEVFLNNKISRKEEIRGVWDEYINNLKQCLLASISTYNFLNNNHIDTIIVYNSLYSLNRSVVKTGETLGVNWRTIHGGKNIVDMLRTVTISDDDSTDILLARSELWEKYRNVPLDTIKVESIHNHINYLFSAKSAFTYSSKKTKIKGNEIRRRFNIDDQKKIILCCLASEDERFATDMVDAFEFKMSEGSELFKDNYQWMSYLINFVEQNTQFHLILRVHPRMFPNKRENQTSPSVAALELFFQNLPKCVSVNMPSDGLSLYDLAEVVDVVVNATSTTGLELLTLGIPVVNHCPKNLFAYPFDFNYIGTTDETYTAAILKASADGWSITNAVNAFRFRSFLFNHWSISMHDAVPSRTRISMLRVATWMCLRRNVYCLKGLIRILQKLELSRCPSTLKESDRIIQSIELDRAEILDVEESKGGLEDEEKLLVQAVLKRVSKNYFSEDEMGTLGWRIRTAD